LGIRELEAHQLDFANQIVQVAKHVILILVQARPRLFTSIINATDAILYAYLTGPGHCVSSTIPTVRIEMILTSGCSISLEGGQAIAEIIFGVVNP
jgi:hypothetical protein